MTRDEQARGQRTNDALKRDGERQGPDETAADDPEQEAQDQRAMQGSLFAQRFSGPLPPPEILEQYDLVVPGMAQQLIEAFTQQGEHRRRLEDKAVTAQLRRADRGQWMAFVLALIAISLGGVAIVLGREVGGLVAVVAALVSLVTVFLKGREQQSKDLRDKRE